MKEFRSGFCSIVGKPNVGKSTLLNDFLGTKLCAVTPKPQTTRQKILGILTEESWQIIFVDTPGIFKPKYRLQKIMVKSAVSSLEDVDIVILMVEPYGVEEELLRRINTSCIIAINKIDKLKNRDSLSPIIEEYNTYSQVKSVIPISALRLVGIEELKKNVANLLPVSQPLYPKDILSTKNERFFVGEIIREKIFFLYGEEVPYSSAVVIDEFKEREKEKHYIKAIIYVERVSERMIIIGKGGKAIKKLGMEARKDIESFLSHPVFLELWVKVRKGWRRKEQNIREFGYER
jgi:GTP-binding protein Era